ncbi:MAG: lysophospholipid acyltransferase family protein [Planctomycetota bacterium]
MFDLKRRAPGRSAWFQIGPWFIGRGSCELFLRVVYRLHVEGTENVPRTGPALFICNHQSFADLAATGAICKVRPYTPMARTTLRKSRIMDFILKQYRAILVDQEGTATTSVKEALREFKSGRTVIIFPEGSRTPDGLMQPFERGLLVLIKRGRIPVVPMAIDGAYDIWPRSRSKPRLSGRMGIKAGPPLSADEILADGPDAGLELLRRRIETLRLEVRATLRQRWGHDVVAAGPADLPYWEVAASTEAQQSEESQARNDQQHDEDDAHPEDG